MSLKGVKTELIKGNYSKASHITKEEYDRKGCFTDRKGCFTDQTIARIHISPKLKFIPQRLIVTAPLDAYGRPQVEFTEFSRLINPLPHNCYCYLESLYINNFIGDIANKGLYFPLIGTIIAQTISSTSTITLTITNNPNGGSIRLYDVYTFKVAEGFVYQAYVSTASATTPVFTILNPNATYSGGQIPALGSGVNWAAGFGASVAAQTITGTFMQFNAVSQGMHGVTSVNVELVDYTNSQVYDTATQNYSRIIGTAPAPIVHNRQDLPTEINYQSEASVQNAGFPISDPNIINNRGLTFRLTINDGTVLLPQPAPQYGPMPYNIAPNYTPSSGGVLVPWGSAVNSTTTYTAPTTQYFVPSFSYPGLVRFTLVFYQLNNIGGND